MHLHIPTILANRDGEKCLCHVVQTNPLNWTLELMNSLNLFIAYKQNCASRTPGIRIKFRSSIVVSPWKWMVGPEAACQLLVPFKKNTGIAWSWLVFVSAKKVTTKCSWRISFFHQMPGSVGLHAPSHWDPLEGTHTLRWGSGPEMTKEGAGHFGWHASLFG